MSTCSQCLTGTFSSSKGASSVTACGPCPSGTYSSAPGSQSFGSCSNKSQYKCNKDGDCNYPSCSALPGSISCNSAATTLPGSPANRCGWGSYVSACPLGYSCYNAGGGACTGVSCYLGTCPDPVYTCSPGTYSWVGCILCPPGSYSSSSGATSSVTCSLCSAGTYSSGSGAAILPCPKHFQVHKCFW